MIQLEEISCIFIFVDPLCQKISSKACQYKCMIKCTKVEAAALVVYRYRNF